MLELTIGEKHRVKVVKYLSKGILVKVEGDNSDNTMFIHLSKISPKFVTDVSDFVTMGEVYEAEVVPSPIPDKPFELSLLALNLHSKAPYTPRATYSDGSLNKSQQSHKTQPPRGHSDHKPPVRRRAGDLEEGDKGPPSSFFCRVGRLWGASVAGVAGAPGAVDVLHARYARAEHHLGAGRDQAA